MRFFSSKVLILATIWAILVFSNAAQATDEKAKLWKVHYQNAIFTINKSFPINLNVDPEITLQGRTCIETQWLAVKYYKLIDCPVRLSVLGKDLYGIQFVFSDDGAYQIDISLYDLRVHDGTKLDELERYFNKRGIQYTKGKDNIATYFGVFYYVDHKIVLCEFRAVVLKNYEDYYFKKTGEAPWLLT